MVQADGIQVLNSDKQRVVARSGRRYVGSVIASRGQGQRWSVFAGPGGPCQLPSDSESDSPPSPVILFYQLVGLHLLGIKGTV